MYFIVIISSSISIKIAHKKCGSLFLYKPIKYHMPALPVTMIFFPFLLHYASEIVENVARTYTRLHCRWFFDLSRRYRTRDISSHRKA